MATSNMKPIVHMISTFDPAYNYAINFDWAGNQAKKNRLVITDAETNIIVYDKITNSRKLEHIISANILKSNKQYSAQISIFDNEGIESLLSDKMGFYCLTTPTFKFSNIVDNQKIENSSYDAIVNYQSRELELLQHYQFYLYNSVKELIANSDVLYTTINQKELVYRYSQLEDNCIYYVRCIGHTVHGFELDTGYIKINVGYITPSSYATLYTENDAIKGIIKINTNLAIIEYNGENTFEYIDDKYIDLKKDTLYYDNGFNINGDFSIKFTGYGFNCNENLIMLTNGINQITIDYIDYGEYSKIKLTVRNAIAEYIKYSDNLTITDFDYVTVLVKRENNLYSIEASVTLNRTDNVYDLYVGSNMPLSVSNGSVWLYDEDYGTTAMVSKDSIVIINSKDEPKNAKNLEIWLEETETNEDLKS